MKLRTAHLPRLPASKSLVEVFGDYFTHLVSCVELFIQEEHPELSEEDIASVFKSATYVIAHPNGWEGTQQSKLRNAAIYAKMVPDTPEGRSRIVFVSEGEASLHYCVKGGHVDDVCSCQIHRLNAVNIYLSFLLRLTKASSSPTLEEEHWILARIKSQVSNHFV